MEVDARDLHGVLVKRDVANEVLGKRRVLSSGAHAHRHRKPFAALDRSWSDDLRRVLGVLASVDLAELRRELFRLLTRSMHTRNAGAQQKEKHEGSSTWWNSMGCSHLVTSD